MSPDVPTPEAPGPPAGESSTPHRVSAPDAHDASGPDLVAALLRRVPAAVLQVRVDGTVVQGNPAWEQFAGSHGTNAADSFFDIWSSSPHIEPADGKVVAAGVSDVLAGRAARFETQVAVGSTTGTAWLQVMAVPVDAAAPAAGAVVLQVDVTTGRAGAEAARAALEEQFRQAQKVEAVGRLAGGVAHDFNNLLTVIMGYNEALDFEEALGDSARDAVQQIRVATDRATMLTRQLLAFSRRQVLRPQALDLRAVAGELMPMLRRLIGEDVHLDIEWGDHPAVVRADPGQLEQVLMNLTVNARQAMPDGGRLSLRIGMADLDADFVAVHPYVVPGRYVELTVTDTGVGMDENTKARLFEPFFTTKPAGQGTGLGLAMVYGIVKESDGYIWVESEPDRGATFRIVLPFVDADVVPSEPVAAPTHTAGGHETVLLVEDEDALRELDRQVLMRYGYRVLHARNGAEAIRVAQEHPGPIHLLLTDVVMPSMSGRQVADAMKALQPDVRVLYMSGYTSDAVARHGVVQDQVAFIQKPMSPPELARKVREVLDQP